MIATISAAKPESRRVSAQATPPFPTALRPRFQFRLRRVQHRLLLAAQDRGRGRQQFEHGVLATGPGQHAGVDQLVDEVAQALRGHVRQQAEGRELVVAARQHLLVLAAAKHVDQMGDAEALAGAEHGGEQLLRRHGRVPGRLRVEAEIAIAAGLRLLAEIAEQGHAPAFRRLAEAQHGVELALLDELAGFRRVGFRDPFPEQHDVAAAEGEPGIRRRPVAPGASGLLVVALDAGGEIEMGDVYILGTDMIKFGKFSDKSVPQIAAESALLALDDAGLTIHDMEAIEQSVSEHPSSRRAQHRFRGRRDELHRAIAAMTRDHIAHVPRQQAVALLLPREQRNAGARE